LHGIPRCRRARGGFPEIHGHGREARHLISTVPVGIMPLPMAARAVGGSVARMGAPGHVLTATVVCR
jgi:hypothetical protein